MNNSCVLPLWLEGLSKDYPSLWSFRTGSCQGWRLCNARNRVNAHDNADGAGQNLRKCSDCWHILTAGCDLKSWEGRKIQSKDIRGIKGLREREKSDLGFVAPPKSNITKTNHSWFRSSGSDHWHLLKSQRQSNEPDEVIRVLKVSWEPSEHFCI